jgi:hypothetical protein
MTTAKRVALLALLTLSWHPGRVRAQAPVVFDRAKTERQVATGQALSPPLTVTYAGAVVKPGKSGDRLYRIHFTVSDVSGTGWSIEIAAPGTTTVSEPLDPAVHDLWSAELSKGPSSATARIKGPAGQAQPHVLVDRIAILDQRPTPQAITPPSDDSQEIGKASARIKQWGKSIARLQFIGEDGNGYFCTAFVVSNSLMLTNNHCISTDAEMRSAFAEFDYDKAGAKVETRRFSALVAHDENLDYALVRLAAPTTRSPLPLKDVALAENKGLLIIEHSAGKPKRFSLVDCKVRGVEMTGLGADKTDFGHFCDTEGGSSGSPIQEAESGTVLGLHHLGFQPTDQIVVNRGVKIGLILGDLAARVPAVRAEIPAP